MPKGIIGIAKLKQENHENLEKKIIKKKTLFMALSISTATVYQEHSTETL